ncbi:MAG TPA: zf-HC2 domain-containing protein [Blastocatellia bacterium]|nr:zf-HC2 domain-containing protein [Blastocatellia bacterium]
MVNEWNKTALVAEFETMLRRRLRSGAAPVAACAGFDFDAASAYLEGALGGSHRAGYESHLAGCATCRRHLIELARLAQCAPLAEAQPATAPDRISAWGRWKEAVAVWFDLSSWNFKWRIAGATGAAFAILIAALGAQSWRQASRQNAVAISQNATSPNLAEPIVQPFQSPTPEPSPQEAVVPFAGDLIPSRSEEQSRVPAPAPLVGPQGNDPNVSVEASNRALAALSNLSGEAPVVAKPMPSGAETAQNPPPRLGAFEATENLAAVSRLALIDPREDSKEQAAKDPVRALRITPLRKDNPMNFEQSEPDLSHETLALGRMPAVNPKPEPRKPQPDESSSGFNLGSVTEAIRRRFHPSRKSSFNSESERKTKPDKREEPNDEAPNPMQVMIRDKIFCFEKCKGPDLEKIRGMLIDREYDFEKQKWNIWTLKIGSEEYKRVLADEPMLKEFFDHGPILIVWKNRIYKVLK